MAFRISLINSGILIHMVMVIILIQGMIFMMNLILMYYSMKFYIPIMRVAVYFKMTYMEVMKF